MELDVTHQLLVYADDVDILGESKRTVNQNTGNLLVANREIILEVNAEETKYIFMSHERTTRQKIKNIKVISPLKVWKYQKLQNKPNK